MWARWPLAPAAPALAVDPPDITEAPQLGPNDRRVEPVEQLTAGRAHGGAAPFGNEERQPAARPALGDEALDLGDN